MAVYQAAFGVINLLTGLNNRGGTGRDATLPPLLRDAAARRCTPRACGGVAQRGGARARAPVA